MREINQKVLQQVQQELAARPKIPDGILFALAVQIDPSLQRMEPRAFHAYYVVPARRALEAGKRQKRKSRRPTRDAPPQLRTRAPRSRRGAEAAGSAPAESTASAVPAARRPGRSRTPPPEPATLALPPKTELPAPPAPPSPPSPPIAAARGSAGDAGEVPNAPAAAPRRSAPPRSRAAASPEPSAASAAWRRERVRAALLAFAMDLAAAEGAAELVGAFERIDLHVDRVISGGAIDA